MLLQHCIRELLSLKTVVYVTHQLELLAAADIVIVSLYLFFPLLKAVLLQPKTNFHHKRTICRYLERVGLFN